MNESDFIRAVHAKLPKEIYRWKISDRFSSGVADAYYSSPKCDLWVEYKYYKDGLPKNVTPNLSMLQIKWLNERFDEGRKIYVIVGSPTDCLIFENKEWNSSKPKTAAVSRTELLKWITRQLC